MVNLKLFVEGGGDAKSINSDCRQGFTKFLTKAGLTNRPRIVACGSRQTAFEAYCRALANGEAAMLLVDSEETVAAEHQPTASQPGQPWSHLARSDRWKRPDAAPDEDCHLMVQCMESWLIADRQTLREYFDQCLNDRRLPGPTRAVESIAKQDVYQALRAATSTCQKGSYDKGRHSFALLSRIHARPVVDACPWARRLVEGLKDRLG